MSFDVIDSRSFSNPESGTNGVVIVLASGEEVTIENQVDKRLLCWSTERNVGSVSTDLGRVATYIGGQVEVVSGRELTKSRPSKRGEDLAHFLGELSEVEIVRIDNPPGYSVTWIRTIPTSEVFGEMQLSGPSWHSLQDPAQKLDAPIVAQTILDFGYSLEDPRSYIVGQFS